MAFNWDHSSNMLHILDKNHQNLSQRQTLIVFIFLNYSFLLSYQNQLIDTIRLSIELLLTWFKWFPNQLKVIIVLVTNHNLIEGYNNFVEKYEKKDQKVLKSVVHWKREIFGVNNKFVFILI